MNKFNEFEDEFDDDERGSQGGTGTDTGEGGRGGKSGTVTGPRVGIEISRDDLLTPNEIRRLLKTHAEMHKGFVDKQKLLRKDRAALKEGKKTLRQMQQMGLAGGGGGRASPVKKHPISDRAQFSGIDRQVSFDPLKNDADTNAEARNENELKYNLRFQPGNTYSPPKLTRY